MKDLSKAEVERATNALFDESKDDTAEQEIEDDKRTSFKIAVKRALDFLFERGDKHILDKTTNLSMPELKEMSRMRSVDGLLYSFYGSLIYENYFKNYQRLKISHKAEGRKNMLEFVGSMKTAEEQESVLKQLGLVQRNNRI